MLIYQIIHNKKGIKRWLLLRSFQKILKFRFNKVIKGKKRAIIKEYNLKISSVDNSINLSFIIEPDERGILEFEQVLKRLFEEHSEDLVIIEKRYANKKDIIEV